MEDSSLSVDEWARALEETRALRGAAVENDDDDDDDDDEMSWHPFVDHFRRHQQLVRDQLIAYRNNNDTQRRQKSSSEKDKTVSKRSLLKTRKALRLAQAYISIPVDKNASDCNDATAAEVHVADSRRRLLRRRQLQQEACEVWLSPLLNIVLIQSVDTKCLQLAAQVLCNLVTDCEVTARKLATAVTNEPSKETIAAKILVPSSDDDKDPRNRQPTDELDGSIQIISWVDLFLACATFRPALASMVACLHNCLASLTAPATCSENSAYVASIASSSLLVSTLLRQIVSAQSVQQATSNRSTSSQEEAAAAAGVKTEKFIDEATEWISLTIIRLSRAGYLPHMYQAIAGLLYLNGDHDDNDDLVFCETVLPEQIVLLHSIRNSVEECHHSVESNDRDCGARCLSLGGESTMAGYGSVEKTHLFLASLFLSIRDGNCDLLTNVSGADGLEASALQLIMDILAETLCEDSRIAASLRISIGRKTALLQELLQHLGSILDEWLVQNEGKRVRDQIPMTGEQQRYVTTIIRVLGNLCFLCPQNQDLLRNTLVSQKVSIVHGTGENSAGASSTVERNGLHVLLSTTSLSYTCFTLREWAVVAIRSALENNIANQAVVAELEAQSAVQSAALEEMGIRVDLDVARGQVSVNPLNEEDGRKYASNEQNTKNRD